MTKNINILLQKVRQELFDAENIHNAICSGNMASHDFRIWLDNRLNAEADKAAAVRDDCVEICRTIAQGQSELSAQYAALDCGYAIQARG